MTTPGHLTDLSPAVRCSLEAQINAHRESLAAQLQAQPLRVLEYVLEHELNLRMTELVDHLLAVHPNLPKRHAFAAVGLTLGRSQDYIRRIYYQEAKQ